MMVIAVISRSWRTNYGCGQVAVNADDLRSDNALPNGYWVLI